MISLVGATSQPFAMTVRHDSGILHSSLMGSGEVGYHTESKCLEVEDFDPSLLCSLHEMPMYNNRHT